MAFGALLAGRVRPCRREHADRLRRRPAPGGSGVQGRRPLGGAVQEHRVQGRAGAGEQVHWCVLRPRPFRSEAPRCASHSHD
eukprot:8562721-Pyramimonas_sp.AAC.1